MKLCNPFAEPSMDIQEAGQNQNGCHVLALNGACLIGINREFEQIDEFKLEIWVL